MVIKKDGSNEISALLSQLEPRVNQRIRGLLERPYEGSKTFGYNDLQARYVSNCHGTVAYVLNLRDPLFEGIFRPDLKDPLLKSIFRPVVLGSSDMELMFKKYFSLSEVPLAGDAIGFYDCSTNNPELFHTAVFIGSNRIFQQTGTGGIFEISTLKKNDLIVPLLNN